MKRYLYRYYDLTKQAEYLYACVPDTIEHVIPEELDCLRYDRLTTAINEIVSLPDHQVDLLIKILQQHQGKLSKGKREKIFPELTNADAAGIERAYAQHFGSSSEV